MGDFPFWCFAVLESNESALNIIRISGSYALSAVRS